MILGISLWGFRGARFSMRAPTGQSWTQRPHWVHSVPSVPRQYAASTLPSKPRRVKSMAWNPATSSQTRTQRPQRMHLSMFRT
ncbi:MAG: hypothetical protein BWY88_00630 [Synergistetes bacterium ADurb.Bin520]|nr:MAG: hypothetical protein BWY88_00630 [Synergistetes bacterium ADurb.Bin520]